MRVLYEVAAGLVTQSPKGDQLEVVHVLIIQEAQYVMGRVLRNAAPMMFSSAMIAELIKRFVY